MLDRIRKGDQVAIGLLLKEEWPRLVRHLTSVAGSTDAAHDAAQEAFVRLWEQRERWEGDSARSILYRVGRNIAIDQQRRQSVRTRWLNEQDPMGAQPVVTPSDEFDGSQMADRVLLALDDLPPRRRDVFQLIRFSGLSYAEVAEVMGISRQTVANQMTKALSDLRVALLDRDSNEDGQRHQPGDQRDG